MMIFRRILGLVMLLTGLFLLAAALAGAYFIGDALAGLAEGVDRTFAVASQSLDTARDTLVLAQDAIGDMDGGLATAIESTASAAQTLSDSRPLLDNVATVTTQEVPEAVEGIQAALPNMIEVAAVIDSTLSTLSSVGIDREIPLPFGGSIPLRFDLGIDYNPTTPFDESLRGFDASLVGLPESLRGLEDDLATTSDNLVLLASNLQATSENLATINTRIGDLGPLLDQYALLIDEIDDLMVQIDTQLEDKLELIRFGVIALMIALGLSQLAPIYLGWELLTGKRDPQAVAYAAIPVVQTAAPIVQTTAVEPGEVVVVVPVDTGEYATGLPSPEDHANP